MTPMDASPPLTIDLDGLGFDRGAHVLVDRALRSVEPGDGVLVAGSDPNLALHLRGWARSQGHEVDGFVVTRGAAASKRWASAVRAGEAGSPAKVAEATWGLAARGALVESGGPALAVADLVERDVV